VHLPRLVLPHPRAARRVVASLAVLLAVVLIDVLVGIDQPHRAQARPADGQDGQHRQRLAAGNVQHGLALRQRRRRPVDEPHAHIAFGVVKVDDVRAHVGVRQAPRVGDHADEHVGHVEGHARRHGHLLVRAHAHVSVGRERHAPAPRRGVARHLSVVLEHHIDDEVGQLGCLRGRKGAHGVDAASPGQRAAHIRPCRQ